MALRTLTSEERSEALAKAAVARQVRAKLKEELRTGKVSVSQALARSDQDPAIARLKVTELLETIPGIGPVRSQGILEQLKIAASRRLGGLGVHQRQALVDFLEIR